MTAASIVRSGPSYRAAQKPTDPLGLLGDGIDRLFDVADLLLHGSGRLVRRAFGLQSFIAHRFSDGFFDFLSRVVARHACTAAALVAGCAAPPPPRVVVQERVVERPAPPPQVRVMPAPIREDRGPAPGPGWNWVPGHWHWVGNDWVWAHGHWVQQAVAPMPPVIVEQITVAPAPHSYWVPGHWVWRPENGGWVWAKGAWHG